MGDGDRLTSVMRLAKRTPLLSRDQELALARRIEQGDARARERMIESNLRLVVATARSQRSHDVPFSDLVQEGCIGLIQAVDRFDYRRRLKFSTYAVWWIRRSIADATRHSQTIRVPAKANRQLAAVRRAEGELARSRCASDVAVAERADVPERIVGSLRSAPRVTASLDGAIGDDGATLRELIVDVHAVDPLQHAIARERRRYVAEVVVRHFGLGDREPESHETIAVRIGVGKERSRQIERESLRRMRSLV